MTREPVSWEVAQRVATRIARRQTLAGSYLLDSLLPDFQELTAEAEALVAAETGLVPVGGPAQVRVTDRTGWVAANIRSFRRLLQPLVDQLDQRGATAGRVTRTVTGVELGTLLGWMSARVLGQYDLLLVEGEDLENQDVVYFVGPNVVALERRFGFPPREFRLWLALHEVTHRAQFLGIPWLRPHYMSLVAEVVGSVDPDPGRLAASLRRAVDEVRGGRNPLAEGGVIGLLATTDQRATLDRVTGMMSLLEGHGDVTMDRAAADRIPSAARFSRVLRARRASRPMATRALQVLLGLDAKLRQYEAGERFVHAVEEAAGRDALRRAWEGPDNLPTAAEIRDPQGWLARVGIGATVEWVHSRPSEGG